MSNLQINYFDDSDNEKEETDERSFLKKGVIYLVSLPKTSFGVSLRIIRDWWGIEKGFKCYFVFYLFFVVSYVCKII